MGFEFLPPGTLDNQPAGASAEIGALSDQTNAGQFGAAAVRGLSSGLGGLSHADFGKVFGNDHFSPPPAPTVQKMAPPKMGPIQPLQPPPLVSPPMMQPRMSDITRKKNISDGSKDIEEFLQALRK